MSSDSLEQRLAEAMKYINNQRQQLQAIRDRLTRIETTLETVLADEWGLWLYRNRTERMDPTVPIFDPERAAFHLARYQFAASRVLGQSVCDIASGTGYGSQLLRVEGRAGQVVGIDLSPDAVAYAAARHQEDGVEFRTGDIAALDLPDASFDVVVSFETIEHVPDEQRTMAELARILKPHGTLICSTPNQWPLEIAPFHTREYNREQFVALLESHFVIESLWNQNSGSSFVYNRGQPAGIVPTTSDNEQLAECFIAVARRRD